jgi:hypothetical protein
MYMFIIRSSQFPIMHFNQNISGWQVDQVIIFNHFRTANTQLANINMLPRFLLYGW